MSNQFDYKLYYSNNQGKTFHIDNQGCVFDTDNPGYSRLLGHLTNEGLMKSIGVLTLDSYRVKVATPTPIKRHRCICGKSFQSPSALKTHSNSHTREISYTCHVNGCGKSYTTRSNLLRHSKIHTRGTTTNKTNEFNYY
ncbi:6954_t:CDS:2 [Acaulospora morrowiae]|uniref:6954_t:CDS:1 n=1 Tax=Acaulospora morrowiae TaxID=94023 RepID=A0A9N9FNB3_9GLOM|nr:6954_t:CDS:2 [Acaulospora morrowiae]